MSTIRRAAAVNVREFEHLIASLHAYQDGHKIDSGSLQDELGRFRVWTGNLGALQIGHSSLDYRLRDAPLLSNEVSKLLEELEENLHAANDIVNGVRLPYESQSRPTASEDDDEEDPFFSEDEDEDEDSESGPGAPKTELSMRFKEVVDILDHLYKISVRIRKPTVGTRSLKAASFRPKDPETGIDLLSRYAVFDRIHTQELVQHLRKPHVSADEPAEENDELVARLARAVTLRRRQFKYWKRHRDKLGISLLPEEPQLPAAILRPEDPQRRDTLEAQPGTPGVEAPPKQAPSQKTGKTILSGTEATHYHQSLDEIVDSRSVTSYAVTVKDLSGKGIELPPPPKVAEDGRDFECPYCFEMCPARYGKGRPWRTHVLQDLEPYVCTYPECRTPDLLYRSRRDWIEHESSHRKAWRCPEHLNSVFTSNLGLEEHFRKYHEDSIPEGHITSIVKASETSVIDLRERCPICYASADTDGMDTLQNHIANHLERIAAFSLPLDVDDDSDAGSSRASRVASDLVISESSGFGGYEHDEDGDDDEDRKKEPLYDLGDTVLPKNPDQSQRSTAITPGLLSESAIQAIPDDSRQRLHHLLYNQRYESESSQHRESTEIQRVENEDFSTPSETWPIRRVDQIPNLVSLYSSGHLQPQDETKYEPKALYNEIISFCRWDITRLAVDAIVNSANCGLLPSRMEWTLNSLIFKAAGPELEKECSRYEKLQAGQSALTGGYQLPCNHIIHVAIPRYDDSQDTSFLVDGYRNALQLALEENIRSLAFCCLGTGHIGYSSRSAACLALQETRLFLDAHPKHSFERIIFCVYTEVDSAAYTGLIPNWFPPTRLESGAPITTQDTDEGIVVGQLKQQIYKKILNVSLWIERVLARGIYIPEEVVTTLQGILADTFKLKDELLAGHQNSFILQEPDFLDLFCHVMLGVCDTISETHELNEGETVSNRSFPEKPWVIYDDNLKANQVMTIRQLVEMCAHHLDDVLSYAREPRYLNELQAWLTTRNREEPDHGQPERNQSNQKYPEDGPMQSSSRAATVNIHQIPTLTQLYEQNILKPKDTLATPSARSNDIVCLSKDDITTLKVDIIVSSTDTHFSGMGRLDRTVFLGGGPSIQEECAKHVPCKEGDVILTGGHSLPAKHVLHAIPPAQYREDTLDVLREMYRKILHMASYLGATTIAIPTLGTGLLNYPRRDSAAIAIGEVKKFLTSVDESNPIEKIVLVVFYSNDEFVYKSVLPSHFPPIEDNPDPSERLHSSPDPIPTRSRTFLGTLGQVIRRISSGNQTALSMRPLGSAEEDMLIVFEQHAQGCPTCSNIHETYSEGRDLCDDGYGFAAQLLRHMHMRADQNVYPLRSEEEEPMPLEIPDVYPLSLELFHTVEKSFRDPDRDRPFVSNQPLLGRRGPNSEYAVYRIEVTVSSPHRFQLNFDRVYIWSDPSSGLRHFEAHEPTVHIIRGAVVVRQETHDDAFRLSPGSRISVQADTEIVVDDDATDRAGDDVPADHTDASTSQPPAKKDQATISSRGATALTPEQATREHVDAFTKQGNDNDNFTVLRRNFVRYHRGRFTLALRSQSDCKMLLTRVKHAAENAPTPTAKEDIPDETLAHSAESTVSRQEQSKESSAQVFHWRQMTRSWEAFDARQTEASLYIRPGSLKIHQQASNVSWRLKLTSYSVIKEQEDVEIVMDRVTTAGDSDADLGHWKLILLRCRSRTERDDLVASLQHAANSSARSPAPSQPPTPTRKGSTEL